MSQPVSLFTENPLNLRAQWKLRIRTVKVMSIRTAWQEGSGLKPLLGPRIPQFQPNVTRRLLQRSLSSPHQGREVASTPAMASHRSRSPGWKAQHACGKAKQAWEVEQNRNSFISVLAVWGFLMTPKGIFKSFFFLSVPKRNCCYNTDTYQELTDVHTAFLKNTLVSPGLFRPG